MFFFCSLAFPDLHITRQAFSLCVCVFICHEPQQDLIQAPLITVISSHIHIRLCMDQAEIHASNFSAHPKR